MGSMDKLFGHVSEIERANREFGGFLSRFANLSPASQIEILQKIAKLKQECGQDTTRFIEEVKTLAEMYGAIAREAEKTPTDKKGQILTEKLGKMGEAAAELRKIKPSSSLSA